VDVPGNLTMRDSTGPTVGNIVKAGAPFIHNFGFNNTFIGSGAGNFTMTHPFGSNTATGFQALHSNINGFNNTASGRTALLSNTIGFNNTASGDDALSSNTTGNYNTAFGSNADVSAGNLTNATAIGFGAIVNASNKIRLGNEAVTVIEGLVGLTARLWSVGSARTAEPGYKRFLHGG